MLLYYLLVALAFYLAVLAGVYFFSEGMIFQPPPPSYSDGPGIIKLETETGHSISAVHLPAADGLAFTLLFSHGNAEDLGHLMPLLEEINRMGVGVFAYDYSGYGTSEGKASEQQTYHDIDAAYRYMTETLEIPPRKIIAHGRSLGGGAAVDLAARRRIGGLILESSFVTAFRVITQVPFFPFDRFNNLSKMESIDCPVLVLHGTDDRVIPFWHGRRLYDEAPRPKRHLWVEGAGHNNLYALAGQRYRQALTNFLELLSEK